MVSILDRTNMQTYNYCIRDLALVALTERLGP